jgi:hypothetical protein
MQYYNEDDGKIHADYSEDESPWPLFIVLVVVFGVVAFGAYYVDVSVLSN